MNIPQKKEKPEDDGGRYVKKGKSSLSPIKPKGLRVDPVRGSAQGTKGGPGEGERPRG